MTPEDYVSYPIALVLKKAGFNEPCDHYWYKVYTDSDKMEMRQASVDDYNNDDWSVPHCSAPHIYHAQKWLREKKELFIEVSPNFGMRARATFGITSHDFTLFDSRGHIINDMDRSTYHSYEAALSAGIAAALELIEKKGE